MTQCQENEVLGQNIIPITEEFCPIITTNGIKNVDHSCPHSVHAHQYSEAYFSILSA